MFNTQKSSKKSNHPFDLEERTFNFSKKIIELVSRLPNTEIIKPLARQIIRSGTSIGANYAEANESNSKKDFLNKISISKKESKETIYWLRLIREFAPSFKKDVFPLEQEARELILIFSAIIKNSK